MYEVRRLTKISGTAPQKYELHLRDLENKTRGYFLTTKYGTEDELRAVLKDGGITEPDIDRLFAQV